MIPADVINPIIRQANSLNHAHNQMLNAANDKDWVTASLQFGIMINCAQSLIDMQELFRLLAYSENKQQQLKSK